MNYLHESAAAAAAGFAVVQHPQLGNLSHTSRHPPPIDYENIDHLLTRPPHCAPPAAPAQDPAAVDRPPLDPLDFIDPYMSSYNRRYLQHVGGQTHLTELAPVNNQSVQHNGQFGLEESAERTCILDSDEEDDLDGEIVAITGMPEDEDYQPSIPKDEGAVDDERGGGHKPEPTMTSQDSGAESVEDEEKRRQYRLRRDRFLGRVSADGGEEELPRDHDGQLASHDGVSKSGGGGGGPAGAMANVDLEDVRRVLKEIEQLGFSPSSLQQMAQLLNSGHGTAPNQQTPPTTVPICVEEEFDKFYNSSEPIDTNSLLPPSTTEPTQNHGTRQQVNAAAHTQVVFLPARPTAATNSTTVNATHKTAEEEPSPFLSSVRNSFFNVLSTLKSPDLTPRGPLSPNPCIESIPTTTASHSEDRGASLNNNQTWAPEVTQSLHGCSRQAEQQPCCITCEDYMKKTDCWASSGGVGSRSPPPSSPGTAAGSQMSEHAESSGTRQRLRVYKPMAAEHSKESNDSSSSATGSGAGSKSRSPVPCSCCPPTYHNPLASLNPTSAPWLTPSLTSALWANSASSSTATFSTANFTWDKSSYLPASMQNPLPELKVRPSVVIDYMPGISAPCPLVQPTALYTSPMASPRVVASPLPGRSDQSAATTRAPKPLYPAGYSGSGGSAEEEQRRLLERAVHNHFAVSPTGSREHHALSPTVHSSHHQQQQPSQSPSSGFVAVKSSLHQQQQQLVTQSAPTVAVDVTAQHKPAQCVPSNNDPSGASTMQAPAATFATSTTHVIPRVMSPSGSSWAADSATRPLHSIPLSSTSLLSPPPHSPLVNGVSLGGSTQRLAAGSVTPLGRVTPITVQVPDTPTLKQLGRGHSRPAASSPHSLALSDAHLATIHQEALAARVKEEELQRQESRRTEDILQLCSAISRSSRPSSALPVSTATKTEGTTSSGPTRHWGDLVTSGGGISNSTNDSGRYASIPSTIATSAHLHWTQSHPLGTEARIPPTNLSHHRTPTAHISLDPPRTKVETTPATTTKLLDELQRLEDRKNLQDWKLLEERKHLEESKHLGERKHLEERRERLLAEVRRDQLEYQQLLAQVSSTPRTDVSGDWQQQQQRIMEKEMQLLSELGGRVQALKMQHQVTGQQFEHSVLSGHKEQWLLQYTCEADQLARALRQMEAARLRLTQLQQQQQQQQPAAAPPVFPAASGPAPPTAANAPANSLALASLLHRININQAEAHSINQHIQTLQHQKPHNTPYFPFQSGRETGGGVATGTAGAGPPTVNQSHAGRGTRPQSTELGSATVRSAQSVTRNYRPADLLAARRPPMPPTASAPPRARNGWMPANPPVPARSAPPPPTYQRSDSASSNASSMSSLEDIQHPATSPLPGHITTIHEDSPVDSRHSIASIAARHNVQLRPRSASSSSSLHVQRQQRPLTRYLPNWSSDLDLRLHLESQGHSLEACQSEVAVTSTSCRGYLTKRSSRRPLVAPGCCCWKRRWFVLDRSQSMLLYYSDWRQSKLKGGVAFSALQEVYVDLLEAEGRGRGGSQSLQNQPISFVVKSRERKLLLTAPSAAAMRLWMDAIVTGCQGNLDYLPY